MSHSADRTAVNYDTVTQAASDVRNTAKNLSEQLETLMRRVKAVAETWEGEAKTAYTDIQRDSSEQMDQMTHKLARIAKLLDDSVVGYLSTDQATAARYGLLLGLGGFFDGARRTGAAPLRHTVFSPSEAAGASFVPGRGT
ncbi:WXG100 family type VII secretion target [Streptomyces seoulensis]|uniref:WXG100 family type VII secretion target n=1 Tax=Streptomyces seoulensis TaxID=73044 RepID=UPI0033A87CA4